MIIAAAALMLSGCAASGNTEQTSSPFVNETDAVYTVETAPYSSIVSPDFRSMLWGMDETQIYSQEKRIADGIFAGIYEYCLRYELETPDIGAPSENDLLILEYRDIESFGCSCRLYYYVVSGRCVSAEYIISAEEQEKHAPDTFEKVDTILTDLYGSPEAAPDGSERIYRSTRTAGIYLYSSGSGDIHVFFQMPEGWLDTPQTSRVVIFEGDSTIVIT